jgi:hypothetical protein
MPRTFIEIIQSGAAAEAAAIPSPKTVRDDKTAVGDRAILAVFERRKFVRLVGLKIRKQIDLARLFNLVSTHAGHNIASVRVVMPLAAPCSRRTASCRMSSIQQTSRGHGCFLPR